MNPYFATLHTGYTLRSITPTRSPYGAEGVIRGSGALNPYFAALHTGYVLRSITPTRSPYGAEGVMRVPHVGGALSIPYCAALHTGYAAIQFFPARRNSAGVWPVQVRKARMKLFSF